MSDKNKVMDLLYKTLAKKRTKKDSLSWKSTGKVFPSSAGTNCEQKLRYDFLGEDKELDFVWHGCENKIGNAIHDWVQENFVQHFGDKVECEMWVTKYIEGLRLNGKVDIDLNKKTLVEIKTVDTKKYKGIDPPHEDQLQYYMGALGRDKAILSYINRVNGIHIESFEIEFDKARYERIIEKFAKVIRGAKNLRTDTRECPFCPYKKKCSSFSTKHFQPYQLRNLRKK